MTTQPDDRIELTSGGVTARLSVERYQEAGGFIARCPALILSAQGATQHEADEAIRLMLADLAERGTLEAVLLEALGWSRRKPPLAQGIAFVPPQVRTGTLMIGPIVPRS